MSGEREQRIAEIKARCEAATVGPWRQSGKGTGTHVSSLDSPAGYQIHSMEWVRSEGDEGKAVYNCMKPTYVKDAAFIAHSRQDIPWLIEQLESALAATDAADAAESEGE